MSKQPKVPQPYWNPYVCGIGLGLVLLAAFVVMGRGIGASGAMTSVVATGVKSVSPSHAEASAFYMGYLGDGTVSPLKDWLVFEVLGVLIGGFLSGKLAHRFKFKVEKGELLSNNSRFLYAFLGGIIMAFGTKLARGCTSGQALTGGALMNVGSWIFMIALFIGAYAMAGAVKRLWT
ncbi:YeeE/YedE thiosulfate transporter family protein [uncultured Imperialibacter sp.]|uniref:YeeE/YedE thiosulfate transporter family protein n=1 Tax=uncultured Imperialibacter sp. TaxID=1672639 RepID=UPI0030D6DE5B|tara:strand:- start:246 stop:776 length:531 start_codon:yes stop_codon:yes gene_type:complete